MNANTNRLRATKDIIDALQERLRDVTLGAPENLPAFEKVELFDLADWEDALRRLALNQQRSAVVIWAGEDWEHQREMVTLTSRRTQSFEVMVSERRLDSHQAALTGDDRSPGVVGLKDRVVAALTGVLLAGDDEQETVYLTITSVQRGVLSVEDKKKEPGRQVLVLSVQAEGEWLQTAVGANETY